MPCYHPKVKTLGFPARNLIKFMLLDDKAKPPIRKHSDDAGADLSSTDELTLASGESRFVPIGVAIELPENCLGDLLRMFFFTNRGESVILILS